MDDVVAVVVADAHLRAATWSKRPEIRGDAFHAFAFAVDQANTSGAPLVLLGDTLDSARPDAETITFLFTQVARLRRGAWYITGNHDRTEPAWLSSHPNARHLSQAGPDVFGFPCRALDFAPRPLIQSRLAEVPGQCVLFAHQSWAEIDPPGDCAASDLPRGEVLVVTGDYHAQVCVEARAADGGPVWLVSPGTPFLHRIDEVGPRQIALLSRQRRVEFVVVPGRPFQAVPVLRAATFEEQVRRIKVEAAFHGVAGLPEELRKPVFRIPYEAAIPDADRRLREEFHWAHLFLEPQYEETVVTAAAPEAAGATVTLGAAVQTLGRRPGAVEIAQRVLQAADKAAEAKRIVTERMG